MIERVVTAYLVVDYRTGAVTAYRKPPQGVVGSKIPIKLRLVLKLPDESKQHEMTATITLSETSVASIAVEELAR